MNREDIIDGTVTLTLDNDEELECEVVSILRQVIENIYLFFHSAAKKKKTEKYLFTVSSSPRTANLILRI